VTVEVSPEAVDLWQSLTQGLIQGRSG
jgi:hypothetical protein